MSSQENRSVVPTWAVNTLLTFGAVGISFVVWSLVEQNKMLKEALAASSVESVAALRVGDVLPDVELLSAVGGAESLGDLTRNGAVVATLTTTCPFCLDTLPAWTQIHKQLASRAPSFVAVSLDPLEETRAYSAQQSIEWHIYVLGSSGDRGRLGVRGVPVTVTVSDDGTVTGVWPGVLSTNDVEEIVRVAQGQSVSPVAQLR